MNVIYIIKEDRKKITNAFNEYISDSKNNVYDNKYQKELILTFIKKNKYVEAIRVNVKIIPSEVYTEDVYYTLVEHKLNINIPKYNYNINISFIEKPFSRFYKEERVRCDNYILKAVLKSDVFGIRELDPFVNFNNFMLKYYKKNNYFDNYIPITYNTRRYYTKKKEMKYCIIITKILIDLMQRNGVR